MKIVGITEQNRFVLSGIFKFFETYGLPLDMIAEELLKKNYVIAWDQFRDDASLAGLSEKKIQLRIDEVLNLYKRALY